jgi:HlyD family secretion protein
MSPTTTRARGARRARSLLAAAALAALPACSGRDDGTLVASGTVEATDAQLGFRIAGRIAEIRAREGDRVEAGALLAVLDRSELSARRAQAEAQLGAARAQLAELASGFRGEEVAQGRSEAEAAEQRFANAERELTRATLLLEGGAISREAHDAALLARDVAAAQRDKAREQHRLLERGYRREQVEAARAQVAAGEAAVAAAEAALRDAAIEAPFGGLVTVRHREPGEITNAGTPVLTVMNPDDRWVRIYVREDRIGAVRIGAKATIRCDTFPGKTYDGEITFLASEAEFTPKSVQTSEERVRLVYAAKVRVARDPSQDLKPGMPADVTLELAPAGTPAPAPTARSGGGG